MNKTIVFKLRKLRIIFIGFLIIFSIFFIMSNIIFTYLFKHVAIQSVFPIVGGVLLAGIVVYSYKLLKDTRHTKQLNKQMFNNYCLRLFMLLALGFNYTYGIFNVDHNYVIIGPVIISLYYLFSFFWLLTFSFIFNYQVFSSLVFRVKSKFAQRVILDLTQFVAIGLIIYLYSINILNAGVWIVLTFIVWRSMHELIHRLVVDEYNHEYEELYPHIIQILCLAILSPLYTAYFVVSNCQRIVNLIFKKSAMKGNYGTQSKNI